MPAGFEAQYLDRVADRTFRDLLDSWIGPNVPGPSRIEPDLQKVDISHQMPSFSRDIGTLPFNWQLKARSKPPRQTDSKILGCRCYRVDVGKSYMRDLFHLSQLAPSFYLALAIIDSPDGPPLTDRLPSERFLWYVVDLKQYCRTIQWEDIPGFIDVPVQNRLNLSLFSLMWAGNWVNAFVAPLREGVGLQPPPVNDLLRSFATEVTLVGGEAQRLLRDAVTSLDLVQKGGRGLTNDSEYVSRLAIVGSLRGITAMLYESSGAERIETYCPEALAGSATLWLFSRTYHEFMRITMMRGGENKRLLPARGESISDIPKFFQATLYNIRALYAALGAKVLIVRELAEGGGDDYSYYSGALGAFQWLRVDSDGHISLNDARLSARADDLDRLRVAELGVLTDVGISLTRGGVFGELRVPDLRLEPASPVCLFPPEDHLVEHPSELWQPGTWSRHAM